LAAGKLWQIPIYSFELQDGKDQDTIKINFGNPKMLSHLDRNQTSSYKIAILWRLPPWAALLLLYYG
jgi:hypothetical protein